MCLIIVGVDEAGRGPVLGPMVVCAFAIEKDREDLLRDLGVKDSKLLSKSKRSQLKKQLERIGHIKKKILSANEINILMNKINLNEIEINAFSEVIKDLINDLNLKNEYLEIYVDACSTNAKKFENELKNRIKDIENQRNLKIKVIAEHKADLKYPVVSSASIIAKADRDEIIEQYKEKYGEIGSGYPSDPKTIKFLEKYFEDHRSLPDIARIHWKTCKKILDRSKQTTLKLNL
ncbi:ribonuclease HII [Methanocaldococcus sp.]